MDPRSMGMAGGIGSLGAGLAGLFAPGPDPYKSANKYFQQIPGVAKQYLGPYAQAGQNAMGQLQGQYGSLINDPNAMMSKFGSGFQQSPGYQWMLNQGQQGINNAAAAGGMAGSQQHQQQAGELSSNLANQDYYNYLNHVMNLYGTGLEGMSGINQLGYGAAGGLTEALTQNLANQGALRYGSQAAQNQARGQSFGDILGGIGTLAAFGGFL